LDKGLWGVAPMPAKEEHGCDSGSESIDKREPRDILHCHVERRYQSFAEISKIKKKQSPKSS
jgi:hypothetical protein